MRCVLIVNENQWIKAQIRSNIEGLGLCDKVFTCNHFSEVTRLIEEINLDLLIANIQQADFRDINVIQDILTVDQNIQIILFSDNQQLVQHDRVYYLDSLSSTEELELLLEHIRNKTERMLYQHKIGYPKYLQHFSKNELNYIFLNDYITADEIGKILDTVELEVFKEKFCVSIIRWRKYFDYIQWDDNFKRQLGAHLEIQNVRMVYFWDAKGQFIIISSSHINFSRFLRFLYMHQYKEVVIAVSDVSNHKGKIKILYNQVSELIKYTIVLPEDIRMITKPWISNRSSEYVIPINDILKLQQMLGIKKEEEILSKLDQIFILSSIYKNNIYYLEQIIEAVNENILKYFNNRFPQFSIPLSSQYVTLIRYYQFSHITKYIEALKIYILRIHQYLINLNKGNTRNNDIDRAIKYIYDNYNKELSMAMVANFVSLNYSYFSQLFKEQTRMNFVDYLKQIRIEKSKELLKDTDDKIYEIAEQVGYQNPKHFMKIFRGETGISPSEFRLKHEKQSIC